MLRRVTTAALVGLLLSAAAGQQSLSRRAAAQQKKVPREPVRFIDASTGKPIPELLLIPRYSSFRGVSTVLGEGPGRGAQRDYLARPFVYHAGTPFELRLPKSAGLPLAGLVFVGKGRTLWGVLALAPGYRPGWFVDLWSGGPWRELRLAPVTSDEEALRLGDVLGPLREGARRINGDCRFWQLPEPCALEVHFDDKERALVRSFLGQAGGVAR